MQPSLRTFAVTCLVAVAHAPRTAALDLASSLAAVKVGRVPGSTPAERAHVTPLVRTALSGDDTAGARLTSEEEERLPDLSDKHGKAARLELDFAMAQRPWLERTLAAPFVGRAAGQPWRNEALAFVREALDQWQPASVYEASHELATRAAKLLEAGCDDPLVQWLAVRARYRATYSWRWHEGDFWDSAGIYDHELRHAVDAMQAAFDRLRETKPCAGAQRLLLSELALMWRESSGHAGHEQRARDAAALLVPALTDGSYILPAEEEILLAHLLRRPAATWIPFTPRDIARAIEPLPLSDATRRCILGCVDLGEGHAFLKSDRPQWEAMRDLAYRRWRDAAEARPELPEPAFTVFHYSRLIGAPTDESPAKWCERTLAAEFDFPEAYRTMLSSLRGESESTRLLSAFGRRCVATRRFDTSVPLALLGALQRTIGPQTPWRPIFRQSENAAALLELGRGMVAEPSRQSELVRWRSLLAVWAWMAGDDAVAAETLALLPKQTLHPVALDQLRDFNISFEEMKAETAIGRSPAKTSFEQGRQQLLDGELAAAKHSFETALSLAPPDAAGRAWIEQQAAIAAFEETLPKQEWIDVPTALSGWQVIAGNWSNAEDGALVLTGDGRPAHIRFRARTGINVEFDGEFEAANPEIGSRELELGIAFRCRFDYEFEQFSIWTRNRETFHVGLRDCFYNARPENRRRGEIPDTQAPQADVNRFHLHTDAQFATFTLNDTPAYRDLQNLYTLSRELRKGQASIGFAARALAPNQRVVIRKLKVRQLAIPEPFYNEKRRREQEAKPPEKKRGASARRIPREFFIAAGEATSPR